MLHRGKPENSRCISLRFLAAQEQHGETNTCETLRIACSRGARPRPGRRDARWPGMPCGAPRMFVCHAERRRAVQQSRPRLAASLEPRPSLGTTRRRGASRGGCTAAAACGGCILLGVLPAAAAACCALHAASCTAAGAEAALSRPASRPAAAAPARRGASCNAWLANEAQSGNLFDARRYSRCQGDADTCSEL
jgi:hypothetical protein